MVCTKRTWYINVNKIQKHSLSTGTRMIQSNLILKKQPNDLKEITMKTWTNRTFLIKLNQ